MKIIFLDIDGVLNSAIYDRQRSIQDGNIDVTRLALIKELVDKTDAKIVLSSSWRIHWQKDYQKCDIEGRELIDTFAGSGLEIYDKTPHISYLERGDEIRNWLLEHTDVESFVIFDDYAFGWNELSENLCLTNYRIERGIEKEHIQKALEILGCDL